jgi:hypothetical protein
MKLWIQILGNYMSKATAKVNGTYIGLYTNVESISKKFVDGRFGSKTNAFLTCSHRWSWTTNYKFAKLILFRNELY